MKHLIFVTVSYLSDVRCGWVSPIPLFICTIENGTRKMEQGSKQLEKKAACFEDKY